MATSIVLIALARLTGALETIRLEPRNLTPNQLWEQVALYVAYVVVTSFLLFGLVIAPVKMWYVSQRRIDTLEKTPPTQHHEHHHVHEITFVPGTTANLSENVLAAIAQSAVESTPVTIHATDGGVVSESASPKRKRGTPSQAAAPSWLQEHRQVEEKTWPK